MGPNNNTSTNLLGPWGKQFNKYMGAYNKYSPYINFLGGASKGGNVGKAAAEAGLDYGMSHLPGVGPIYQGVKTFNDLTGGVNFNKMFHIKNPLTGMWNGLWGTKPKSPEEQQAEDPEYAKYMSMLSDMQNTSAATERAALEKRKAIQPMQEKAVSDYMDILQNGLSSRQLAPVYAAGEARNRAIGAGAEAGLMSQVANRGMGGGIQAGLEAGVQANRNAMSADLNSRITGQQIAARPGMLGQAANLTMGLENQLQQELAQAGMNRLNAANVGLQAYNAAQTNKRYQQQLDYEKQVAREQEYGQLLGKFGPDISKGIKALIAKGVRIPGMNDNAPTSRNDNMTEGTSTPNANDTSGAWTEGFEPSPQETVGETGFQTSFDTRAVGPTNQANMPDYQPITSRATEARLAQVGGLDMYKWVTLPEHSDVEFMNTPNGWVKRPKRMQGTPFTFGGNLGNGRTYDTSGEGSNAPGQQVYKPIVFGPF